MSYIGLERKLTDERRANEILIVQKGDTMNRLAQVLEESQAQCRNLMAQNDPQQVIQLQAQVKKLTQQKDELHRHVQELQVIKYCRFLSKISERDFYYAIIYRINWSWLKVT